MEIEELRERIRQWKARTQGAAVMDGTAAPAGGSFGLPEGGDVADDDVADVPVDVGMDGAGRLADAGASPVPPQGTPVPVEASPAPPAASPAPADPAGGDAGFVIEDAAPAAAMGEPDDTMDIDIDDAPSEALQAAERLGVDLQPPEGESTTEIEVPPGSTDAEPRDQ